VIAAIVAAVIVASSASAIALGVNKRRKQRAWRPAGYSAEIGPDWWMRPLHPIAIRQSVVLAGDRSPVTMLKERDPRVVTGSRCRVDNRRDSRAIETWDRYVEEAGVRREVP